MTRNRTKRGRRKRRPAAYREPSESSASDTVTVAWAVSVTGVLIADLIVVAAHLLMRYFPQGEPARWLEAILLVSAAAMGAISLVLLAVVWRTRRVKPPRGYIVFAVLVAAGPIIAVIGRLLA